MGAFPSSLKFEVEWVTGSNTWTDITVDVDLGSGFQTSFARQTPYGQAQPAHLTFQLNNSTGKYTPGMQVLADGVTAHPYYPNVIPRRRIRVSFVYSSTTYYLYRGYVRGWPTPLENGFRPYVTVQADCRLFLLQDGRPFRGWFREQLAYEPGSLVAYYPMSDDAPASGLGSASFVDVGGNSKPPLNQPYIGQSGYQPVSAGGLNPMPQSEGQTGASFQVEQGSTTNYGGLAVSLPEITLNGTTMGFWVTLPPTVAGVTSQLEARFSTRVAGIQYCSVRVHDTGSGASVGLGEAGTSGAITYYDVETITTGVPHYIQFGVEPQSPNPFQMKLRIDGHGVWGEDILDSFFPLTQLEFSFYQSSTTASSGPIVLGPVLVSNGTYAASTVPSGSDLYNAGCGWAGQATGLRIAWLLAYAGIYDMLSLDAGAETMSGEQTILGRDPLSCIQEVVDTEGGGAVFYTQPDGYLRFQDRNFRVNGLLSTPSLVVDAVKDLDGSSYSPAYDDDNLIVSSTVGRPGGATQTYTDTVNAALMQSNPGEQITSYASTDAAALALAQWRVSSQSVPQWRLDQLTVDALTSETANIYYQLQRTAVGALIEVDSLTPGTAAPSSVVRLFAEGWSDDVQISDNGSKFTRTYNTSPPTPPMLFTDDADFGRVSEDPGTWTLTSTVTSSATSVSLTTTSGHPVLTNTAGDLPLSIQIGAEVLQVTAVSGSSSPQTLTVVRGRQNTISAGQSSGSSVTLWPGPRLTL